MLSSIPFEIPARLLLRFEAGELIRYGTILKDVGTGRIVGHLQETGLAQSLISTVLSGVPTPLSLARRFLDLGSNIYTAVEVSRLRAMVQTLQSLQLATLGVSLVGIGVSVAGFVYMHKRLNGLDARIKQVLQAVEHGFEEQRKSALRVQLARSKSLVDRARHARELQSPAAEYMSVAAELSDQAAFFEGEIAFLMSLKKPADLSVFWQLAQTLMLCNAVRVDCELRSNELRHAFAVTEAVASSYWNLFRPLTPMSFNGSAEEGLAAVQVLRDASDAAACKPYLVDHLRMAGIRGDDYLNALEREQAQPLLFLGAA